MTVVSSTNSNRFHYLSGSAPNSRLNSIPRGTGMAGRLQAPPVSAVCFLMCFLARPRPVHGSG